MWLVLGFLLFVIVIPYAPTSFGVTGPGAGTGQFPQLPKQTFQWTSATSPFDLLPEVSASGMHPEGITTGLSCTGTTTATSATCSLTLAAGGALVVINTAVMGTVAVSAVTPPTVGLDTATQLAAISSGSSETTEVWYVFTTSSGAQTVTVTFSGTVRGAIVAQSFTGTVTSAPFFEATNTATGLGPTGQAASVSVAAGTLGRRIFQAVGGAQITPTSTGSIFAAPGSGQTEINEADLQGTSSLVAVSGESNDVVGGDTSAARTMTATLTRASSTIAWATVGTAILSAGSGVTIAKGSAGSATELEPQRAIWQNPRGQKAFYAIVQQGGTAGLHLFKSTDGSSWTDVQQLAGTGSGYSATYSASVYPYDPGSSPLVVYVCYAEGLLGSDGGSSKIYYRQLLIPDGSATPTVGAEQDTGHTGGHCNIARDRNGYVHILKWGTAGSSALIFIFGTTSPNPSNAPTWSAEATVINHGGSSALDDTSGLLVFGGTSGNILGVFGQHKTASNNILFGMNIASFNGATYSIPSCVNPLLAAQCGGFNIETGSSAYHPLDAVVDSGNVAHLVFHDAASGKVGLRYTKATAANTVESWGTVINIDGVAPDSASLTIDLSVSPNRLYVFYQKATTDTIFWRTKTVDTTDTAWSSENSITDGSGEDLDWIQSGRQLQACVTPVMYTTQTSFNVRFLKFTGTGCAPSTATLTVIKHVSNTHGGTAVASDFTLHVKSGSSDVSGSPFSGAESPGTSFTLNAGTYVVSEDAKTGYTSAITVDCDSGGSITLSAGDSKTCTITNSDVAPTLTVIKVVSNTHGGAAATADFQLHVKTAGSDVSGSPFAGSGAGTTFTLTAGVSYTVSEDAKAGYTSGLTGDCSVTLSVGDTKTCTITNSDVAPQLIVIKHVINDNGGTKTAGDFTITVTGSSPSPSSFGGAESPGTTVTLNAGSYNVGETGPSGYGQSLSTDCSGSIAIGETKTCTITNDDIQPQLIVVKHVVNDNGGTATASQWTISVTGNSASPSSFAGAESPGTTVTLNAGTYSVAESGGPSGYAASPSSDCSSSIGVGETKTCTITNDDIAPQLIVIKDVVNDNGGTKAPSDFSITVTGSSPSPSTFAGAGSPGTTVTLNVGSYSVSESPLTGYSASYSTDCTGSIALGETKTCTITNDDVAPTLIVIKHVVNDNGGTATAGDFTISITGNSPSPSSFSGAESPGTTVSLNAGSYSVGETGPSGYTASPSADCTGSIAAGETKTCTITNDDIQPTLIVIKHVTNDNGGTAAAVDFTITVTGNGPTPSSFSGAESPGTTVNLNAGSYSVGETGPSGYTRSDSTDCSGSVAIGETKTCTITNDDIQPTLVVIKHVITDNGGTATASDFTISVTGNSPSPSSFAGAESPGTTVTLNAGPYSVSETGPTGYSKSASADCSGSIGVGESKTCTITNDDIVPTLIVIKHVVNDNGGTAVASDWTITVTGSNPSPSSFSGVESPGTTVTLNAGSYSVSESGGPSGYSSGSSADCSGTIDIGETKTCTITNDDTQPLLTVTKVVVNNNGGTAAVTDFTLKVGATTVTSGEQNGFNAATYTISETGPSGYAATFTSDCAPSGSITLHVGDVKSCTITNDDIPSTLIVIKHVINDDTGTKHASDFTITVTGTNPSPASFPGAESPGTTVTLDAGSYSVSETGPYLYTETNSADCSGTIGIGQTKTCTITNNDVADHDGDGIPDATDCNPTVLDNIVVDPNNLVPPSFLGLRYNTLQDAVKHAQDNYVISMYADTKENVDIGAATSSGGNDLLIVGCGHKVRAASSSLPVIHVEASAGKVDSDTGKGAMDIDIEDLDVYGGSIGYLIETSKPTPTSGTSTLLKAIRADTNGIGIKINGNGNQVRGANSVSSNKGIGIQVIGNNNVVQSNRIAQNGGNGVDVAGNGNTIEATKVGEAGIGNLGIGINVSGSGNTIDENDVFASKGDGIVVSGGTNILLKNDVGEKGKGNGGKGIKVAGNGNTLQENDVFANTGDGIFASGNKNILLKNDVGDKDKGNGGQGINVAGTSNTIQENNVFANGGDGINVSGGTATSPNVIYKNKVGDRNKSNGGNGIVVAGAGNGNTAPVEIEQNTVTYNTKEGIKVSGSGHQLKNNVAANNGSCEYDLTSNNIDSGGNKSNGKLVALKPGCTE